MAEIGFFNEHVLKVARAINSFPVGSTIETRHVKKAMKKESGNRSITAFISRALAFLNHGTFLELETRSSPKRYKITSKIDVPTLRSIMEKKRAPVNNAIDPPVPVPGDDKEESTDEEIAAKFKKIEERIVPDRANPGKKVDAVARIVMEEIASRAVGSVVSTRDVTRKLTRYQKGIRSRRIAIFVSRVMDYLEQERIVKRAANRAVKSVTIEKEIDPVILARDVVEKHAPIANSGVVLDAAFTLLDR